MAAAHHDLPAEFPVFPLSGALLLPGGKLPLNIFEKRYLRMVDDSMANGRMFGMIQHDESRASTPSGPALYRVGCLGRLTSFSETEDGRYLITLSGVIRFGVKVELEVQHGYRRVRANLAKFKADLVRDQPTPIDRSEMLSALRAYFQAQGFDANWAAIEEMPDAALVNTLAMVCPFETPEKQALLEAATDRDRADTLLTLLQMGAHTSDAGTSRRRAT